MQWLKQTLFKISPSGLVSTGPGGGKLRVSGTSEFQEHAKQHQAKREKGAADTKASETDHGGAARADRRGAAEQELTTEAQPSSN